MSKRLFDIFWVIPGLIVLTPIFVVIAIAVKLESKGPVIFRQTRVGLNGKLFNILKFRTMSQCLEGEARLKITVDGDKSITRIGYWLRKLKLDEFPQLINVLLGEMSLVGPRPEVPEYVEYYPQDVKDKVLSVRPGITDLASLEFRDENKILANESDPVEAYINKILPIKLNYYMKYIKEQSLLFDLKIILKTLTVIHK